MMGNRHGTRWRGKLPIPRHCHPLVRQFFRTLNEEQTTISEVAARTGHRRGTISDWRYRRAPSLADFDAALNTLDLELTIRRKRR
jgi:hypothetical protein